MDEIVDVLQPPLFEKTGETKTRQKAYDDGDWIGTFNLWIFSADPVPSVVYQLRSPKSTWAPNKLDVTAGGHYESGEELTDGLREVREELGKDYPVGNVVQLGRKIYVGFNTDGSTHNNLIDIFMVQDDGALEDYVLEENEVYAIVKAPIDLLIKAHTEPDFQTTLAGLRHDGQPVELDLNKQSFPENWDDYHYKMAVLAQRYFNGESNLIY